MKAYCPRCEEIRTDNSGDAWGFVYYTGIPICQRCHCIVEFPSNGQDNEEELEEYEEEETE